MISPALRQEIIERYSSKHEVRHIDVGFQNDIYVIDNQYVLRVPREDWARQLLKHETMVLNHIAESMSVQVPVVVEAAKDNTYAVCQFIDGDVITDEDLAQFTAESRNRFVADIVQMILELNHAISVAWYTQHCGTSVSRKIDPEANFSELTRAARRANHPHLRLFEKWRAEYETYRPEIDALPSMVVHGDLHVGNMVFKDQRLVGVLDFGDTRIDTLQAELRQLYRYGEDMVIQILDELGGRSGDLSIKAIRCEAILHETSVLLRSTLPDKYPREASRIRYAKILLQRWLGDEWDQV